MDLYTTVWGSVTNGGTRWTLSLFQFLKAHLVALFAARWKMACQWANTNTANCHHSWDCTSWLRQKASTVLPLHNYSQCKLVLLFWDIRAASFFTTHLSTLSKCYIDFHFTNQWDKHTRRQLWAIQDMRRKEIGLVLQCWFKKIKIPFHFIHCCSKSHVESIHQMVSKDLRSSNRNVIQL